MEQAFSAELDAAAVLAALGIDVHGSGQGKSARCSWPDSGMKAVAAVDPRIDQAINRVSTRCDGKRSIAPDDVAILRRFR